MSIAGGDGIDLTKPLAAIFGLRNVESNNLLGDGLYRCDGRIFTIGFAMRPVVTLKANLRLGSGDGSKDNPYTFQ